MPAGGKRHTWREADRIPVSLVRRVCDCGCKRQKIQIVTANGHTLGVDVPSIGAVASPASLRKAQGTVSLGRDLYELWQRYKSVLG